MHIACIYYSLCTFSILYGQAAFAKIGARSPAAAVGHAPGLMNYFETWL